PMSSTATSMSRRPCGNASRPPSRSRTTGRTSRRNLRRGRTGLIALGIPSFDDHCYAELAQHGVAAAERHHLTVLVDCTFGSLERERHVLDGFRTHMVDGLILCPRAIDTEDLRDRRDPTPLVLLGEREHLTADNVAVDSRDVARAAVEHLVALGRTCIGVVGFGTAAADDVMAARRLEGCRIGLAEAGHSRGDERIVILSHAHRPDDAGVAAVRLLREHPEIDALFCFNDEFAVRVVRDLLEAGHRVPEDVAVLGIDDLDLCEMTRPRISTIAPNKAAIAESALTMLIDRIDGNEEPPRHVRADFSLVVRESTGSDWPPSDWKM
ncbi:MAG: LacI family DNA-binding transcriptional regulator, partial [Mycobacteriales bacterium]